MNARVQALVEQALSLCLQARVRRLEATKAKVETWNCFICDNDSPRGGNCQFCTPCACFDCGAVGEIKEEGCGDLLCAGCIENRNEAAAERQYESMCEEFYGGSAPFTDREKADYADREERGLL